MEIVINNPIDNTEITVDLEINVEVLELQDGNKKALIISGFAIKKLY